ncbi:MAG: xanthine dehydrogenase family protein subunit M [Arenibacterium sp.]
MSTYLQPETLEEALSFLQSDEAVIAAGCTDLFAATEARALSGTVLDVTRISEMQGISRNKDGWRIGGATTWSELIAADLPPAFDMLKAAAREVGSVQIQNSGTVAGNLCNASPAADGVPPLLALEAEVILTSAAGTRQMPLAAFLTGARQTVLKPGELLSAVHIPATAGAGQSWFLKLGARKYLVISIAMVALRIEVVEGLIKDIALAIGACSPVALRLNALEARLQGQSITSAKAVLEKADLSPWLHPIDDIRATAEYRRDAAKTLMLRAFDDVIGAGT